MRLLDLARHLKREDCIIIREGSNHTIYHNPRTGKNAPVPRHREIKNLLVAKICRQLEITSPL